MAPSAPPPDDDQARERRLLRLYRAIAAAQARLAALHGEIEAARSDTGRRAAHDALAENKRLTAANRVAAHDAEHAQAALVAALRVSRTDSLTGPHNREVLWDRLAHDVSLARRQGHGLAVYFIDIDDFKQVNDAFGHAVGDLLLQHAARVLQGTVRESDTVCRIGGDEFVILATVDQRDDAERMANKIRLALGLDCMIGGYPMAISASIGYSLFPEDGDAPGVLVHKADKAMYRRKRALGRPG